MTIKKGSPFLRVTHADQTSGSLLLADLADEENAQENKKIPVYVPEGGFIDLPFEEDVLLSYQQGTIKGLEDQGFITTTVIDDNGAAPEIWVAPDGSDDNPGTRNAPYASIQKAVDDLYAEFGAGIVKTVRLKWGQYTESVVLNTTEWDIEARENPLFDEGALWKGDGRPALTVTNATKDSVESFYAAGGVDYTANNTSFSYDGEDMNQLVFNDDHDVFDRAKVKISGITFQTNGATMPSGQQIALCFLGAKDDPGDSFGSISEIEVIDCLFDAQTNNETIFYAKNAHINWRSRDSSANTSYLVFDESVSQFERVPFSSFQNQDSEYIVRVGGYNANEYSGGQNLSALSIFNLGFVDGSLKTYFGTPFFGDTHTTFEYADIQVRNDIRMNGLGGLSTRKGGEFDLRAERDVYVSHDGQSGCVYLSCRDLICDGAGSFFAQSGEVRRNVTSNNGSMTLSNMVISGDLTVNAPAVVNLINVIVKGDLLGDGTVNRSGSGFEGSVVAFTGTDNNATLN